MKHSFALLILTGILLLSGCRKKDSDFDNLPEEAAKSCRIEKMVETGTQDTASFAYNAAGNPLYIQKKNVHTGNRNYVFGYDSKNRLSDFVEAYEQNVTDGFERTAYLYWHRYAYDINNRIVADTSYTSNHWGPPQAGPGVVFEYTDSIQYDAWGRITQLTIHPGLGSSIYTKKQFTYNAQGNLEKIKTSKGDYRKTGPDTVDTELLTTYDTHPSMIRTNEVWMFLCRNYSLNNNFTVTSYNEQGLPLSHPDKDAQAVQFLSDTYAGLTIKYSCP